MFYTVTASTMIGVTWVEAVSAEYTAAWGPGLSRLALWTDPAAAT